MSDLPQPLTPADCDLRGYDWMKLFGHRLFNSGWYLAALKDSRGGIAALKLWWVAMNQVPAGSLPNDEEELSLLADFGSDIRAWRKHRPVALRGFILCSDNRWHHPFLAELAADAFATRKKTQHQRDGSAERMRRHRARGNGAEPPPENSSDADPVTRNDTRTQRATQPESYAQLASNISESYAQRSISRERRGEEKRGKKEGAATRLQRAREARSSWDFLPTDWKPSEKCRMHASVLGFDEPRFAREADRFRSHYGKSKVTSRDWNWMFELWLNEAKSRDNDPKPAAAQTRSQQEFDAFNAKTNAVLRQLGYENPEEIVGLVA